MTESGGVGPARARFVVHALHGPPRPVLVLAVSGEVDRTNDRDLIAQLRHVVALARTRPGGLPRAEFGARSVARTVVVDLRGATFVGARALAMLARARDADGDPVRIVAPRDGVVRRALAVLGSPACRLYADAADAVLGVTDPTEHAVD